MTLIVGEISMKKFALVALVMGFAASAQAADYPAECRQLLDLTFEAAEVLPEMKAQLGMDKETMLKVSLDAWDKMSDAERKSAIPGCKSGVEQMKQIIEAAKASKK